MLINLSNNRKHLQLVVDCILTLNIDYSRSFFSTVG